MAKDDKEIKTFIQDGLTTSFDDHIRPEVCMPEAVSYFLTESEITEVKAQCLAQFEAAKIALEESIADVLVNDKRSLDFAGELAQRILIILETASELGLVEPRSSPIQARELIKAGLSDEMIAHHSRPFFKELGHRLKKSKIISQTNDLSNLEKGNETEPGFVGLSPIAIEKAVKGNLRERMYIPYKTTHGLTKELFSKIENVRQINEKLEEKGYPWKLNGAIIQQLLLKTVGKYGGIYAYGEYAIAREGSRLALDSASQKAVAQKNPSVKEQQGRRQPLSHRELLAQTGDFAPESKSKVKWLSGQSWFQILPKAQNPSLMAAMESKDPMITGISGTTDSVLTMGFMLGLFEGSSGPEKMRDAITACMGWMIDAKDHSAHEILTSSKSFGFHYQAGPKSYELIRPGDEELLRSLKEKQMERGFKMPDEYLSLEHVMSLVNPKIEENRAFFDNINHQLLNIYESFVKNDKSLLAEQTSELFKSCSIKPEYQKSLYLLICQDKNCCEALSIDFDLPQDDKLILLDNLKATKLERR